MRYIFLFAVTLGSLFLNSTAIKAEEVSPSYERLVELRLSWMTMQFQTVVEAHPLPKKLTHKRETAARISAIPAFLAGQVEIDTAREQNNVLDVLKSIQSEYLLLDYGKVIAQDAVDVNRTEAQAEFKRVREALEKQQYPAWMALSCACREVGLHYRLSTNEGLTGPPAPDLIKAIERILGAVITDRVWMGGPGEEVVDQWMHNAITSTHGYVDMGGLLDTIEAVAKLPQASPWMRAMLQGRVSFSRAMQAGKGMTQAQQYKVIDAQFGQARACFEQAWNLDNRRFAGPFMALMSQARQPMKSLDLWLERTVSIDPDSVDAFTSAITTRNPGWGKERSLASALSIVERTRVEMHRGPDMPLVYLMCVFETSALQYDWQEKMMITDPAVWNSMKSIYEKAIQQTTSASTLEQLHEVFGSLAYASGHEAEGTAALKLVHSLASGWKYLVRLGMPTVSAVGDMSQSHIVIRDDASTPPDKGEDRRHANDKKPDALPPKDALEPKPGASDF